MKQLTRLKITNLFGRRSYDLDFAAKDGFTFLAGPNGYGKSTILKLIYAISKGNYFFFDDLRFEEIEAYFAEGEKKYQLVVKKLKRQKEKSERTSDLSKSFFTGTDWVEDDGSFDNSTETAVSDAVQKAIEAIQSGNRDSFAQENYKHYFKDYLNSLRVNNKRLDEESYNNQLLTMMSDPGKGEWESFFSCQFSFSEVGKKADVGTLTKEHIRKVAQRIDSYIDSLERVPGDLLWKKKGEMSSNTMTLSDVFYAYHKNVEAVKVFPIGDDFSFLKKIRFKCVYVGANRQSSLAIVSRYIRETAEKLKRKNAKVSQSLDMVLLNDVLQGLQKQGDHDLEELRNIVEKRLRKFKRGKESCEKYGFSFEDKGKEMVLAHGNLPSDYSSLVVMDRVLSNANDKLKVYKDFIKRLEYFEKSINNIVCDIEIHVSADGVAASVKDENIPKEDRWLPLEKLSSGEQQLIAVLGEMLFDLDFAEDGESSPFGRGGLLAAIAIMFSFEYEDDSASPLILVDEPEISMHPAWQEALSKLYFEIQKKFGKDFIIATHSPAFIGERWDKVIDLLG